MPENMPPAKITPELEELLAYTANDMAADVSAMMEKKLAVLPPAERAIAELAVVTILGVHIGEQLREEEIEAAKRIAHAVLERKRKAAEARKAREAQGPDIREILRAAADGALPVEVVDLTGAVPGPNRGPRGGGTPPAQA
jgi:hypothetical protein